MHNHSHEQGHVHHNRYGRAFAIGIFLNVGFLLIEFGYGLAVNSMALVADAGHNLTDVIGLLAAWGAARLADKPSTKSRTYGYRKGTILASLFNGVFLVMAVAVIAYESIERFITPEPIEGLTIVYVAGIGVIINTVTALLFLGGRKEDLNIKGAFLHMAADAAVSLGVVAAGLVIYYTGVLWIDPVISLVIAAIIFIGTWSLLKESFHLSLDAVPYGYDLEQIRNTLTEFDLVEDVHDIHIWAMSTTETALTAHVIKGDPATNDRYIATMNELLRERHKIHHITLQIESSEAESGCSHNN